MGGALSVLFTLLFSLLMGLCLYRPFHHYSDRGVSGFLAGMCLLLLAAYLVCLGQLDFLFRSQIPAGRLLLAALLYGGMIFCFRSLYQAGGSGPAPRGRPPGNRCWPWRPVTLPTPWPPSGRCRPSRKKHDYALDTITVMLADGLEDKVPQYIRTCQENAAANPMLAQYTDNPYLSAVIATKAAFAAQNHIEFACSAAVGKNPLKTSELCLVVNELLTPGLPGRRRPTTGNGGCASPSSPGRTPCGLRCSTPPTRPPTSPRFSLKGKSLSQVLQWLFDDAPRQDDQFRGLENTAQIVERYSGEPVCLRRPGGDHPPGRRPLLTKTQYRAALPFLGGGPLPYPQIPTQKGNRLWKPKTL